MTAPVDTSNVSIEPLPRTCDDADLRDLAALLVDAVHSGAAVSFLAPLSIDRAQEWWRSTLSSLHPKAVVLVARDRASTSRREIVGTVQLQPAWAPNQPHRAEVCKVLVHRRYQRAGLGRQLMHAIEHAALERGFSLLTLDAKAGGPAEKMYQRLGWTFVGAIPSFALDTDGTTPHDAVIYYKSLRA